MTRVLLLLLGIVIGVGAMLALDRSGSSGQLASSMPEDEDEDEEVPVRVHRHGDVPRIELSAAEITLADIALGRLSPVRVVPEQLAVGRVANGADVLALLRDLQSARGLADAQQTVANTLLARLQRLRVLHARGEISVAKELAALEVEYSRELNARAEHAARIATLRTALLGRWGPDITDLAAREPARLAPLQDGRAHLVEFSATTTPPATVFAAAGDQRAKATPVQVLGAAATTLGAGQGASYLGLSDDPALRVGTPLTVWIPQPTADLDGVLLPASAIVWHRGQQWYYVALAPGSFERRRLGASHPHALGVVLPTADAPQSDVVLRGSQLLLAEEFRGEIPEEDDD